MRRLVAAALGFAALALIAALSFAVAQRGSGTAKDSQVHSTIKDLMVSIIDPSADELWGAVGTVLDKDDGLIETFPKTEEEWLDVRHAAVRIIEGSNLLMTPGREAAPPGTKSETPGVELEPVEITTLINGNRSSFDGFSAALRGLGWEALQASEAKNAASLMDIGGRMQEVCEGCHQTFWYPNASTPQSGEQPSNP